MAKGRGGRPETGTKTARERAPPEQRSNGTHGQARAHFRRPARASLTLCAAHPAPEARGRSARKLHAVATSV